MAKKAYVRNSDNTAWVELASATTDLTNYATKTYADNAASTAVTNLIDAAPSSLNTLNELAAALGDDANYASTITTALGNKLDSATAATTYVSKTEARPNFLVYLSVNTTAANDATIGYNTKVYDDLNNFSTSTATFTVPAGHAGTYSFTVNANVYNIGSGTWRVQLVTTGSNAMIAQGTTAQALGASDTFASAALVVKLAAGDTVRAVYRVPSTGTNSGGISYNSFSGTKLS